MLGFGVCLGVRCDWKDCDFMASGEGHLGRHVYVKHQKIAIVKLLNMKSV